MTEDIKYTYSSICERNWLHEFSVEDVANKVIAINIIYYVSSNYINME